MSDKDISDIRDMEAMNLYGKSYYDLLRLDSRAARVIEKRAREIEGDYSQDISKIQDDSNLEILRIEAAKESEKNHKEMMEEIKIDFNKKSLIKWISGMDSRDIQKFMDFIKSYQESMEKFRKIDLSDFPGGIPYFK
jgi:hypothetical protein